jgi:hypothetical protein
MAAADVCSGAQRAGFMQREEAPLDPSAFSQCVQLFPHFFTIGNGAAVGDSGRTLQGLLQLGPWS